MRLRAPSEVRFTAGVSGIVLILVMIHFDGATILRDEALVLAGWALVYLVECALRRLSPLVSGTRRAAPNRAALPQDPRRDARVDAGT